MSSQLINSNVTNSGKCIGMNDILPTNTQVEINNHLYA